MSDWVLYRTDGDTEAHAEWIRVEGLSLSPFLTGTCASHSGHMPRASGQYLVAMESCCVPSPGSAFFPETPPCTLMVGAVASLNRFWPHKGEECSGRAGKGPHFLGDSLTEV